MAVAVPGATCSEGALPQAMTFWIQPQMHRVCGQKNRTGLRRATAKPSTVARSKGGAIDRGGNIAGQYPANQRVKRDILYTQGQRERAPSKKRGFGGIA